MIISYMKEGSVDVIYAIIYVKSLKYRIVHFKNYEVFQRAKEIAIEDGANLQGLTNEPF